MDYNIEFKERLRKLLFLEVDFEGFKRSVNIPLNIKLKGKDLYLPISSKYIVSNVADQIKINNLPIYYFIEGMLLALGADNKMSYSEDYIILLNNIKDSEKCGKSLVSARIKEDDLIEAYLLIKGLYLSTGDLEYYKKLLLVAETIREKDKGFTEILEQDINEGLKEFENESDPYLYKAIIYKDKGDYKLARIEIDKYINYNGEVTKDNEAIINDIKNVSDYEKAVDLLEEDPERSIQIFLSLLEKFNDNPLIYYYLGVGYRKINKFNKAIYYLDESLRLETGILEVILELGLNYACLQDFTTAIKYFKKAFEASKDVSTCTNIVMCYLNLGDMENARLHYKIAKELDKDDEIVKKLERLIK